MVWSAAGRLSIDPRPFTWRQLDDMDDAKRKEEWQHTGDICYAACQPHSKSKLDRSAFDRHTQARRKAAGPSRTIKPSEMDL